MHLSLAASGDIISVGGKEGVEGDGMIIKYSVTYFYYFLLTFLIFSNFFLPNNRQYVEFRHNNFGPPYWRRLVEKEESQLGHKTVCNIQATQTFCDNGR